MKKLVIAALLSTLGVEASEISVKASVYYNDYKENELRADGKYKGINLEIRGLVDRVKNEDYYGSGGYQQIPAIVLLPNVKAFLAFGQETEASRINQGDEVILECLGLGMNGSYYPALKDCKIGYEKDDLASSKNHVSGQYDLKELESSACKKNAATKPAVVNSPLDQSVEQVLVYLKRNTHAADSIKVLEWGRVKAKKCGYEVRCKYQSKNVLGMLSNQERLFVLNEDGVITDVRD